MAAKSQTFGRYRHVRVPSPSISIKAVSDVAVSQWTKRIDLHEFRETVHHALARVVRQAS